MARHGTLQEEGVIAAPVRDGRDLVEGPHLHTRGFCAEMDHPDVGRRRYPGSRIKLSETPGTYCHPLPGLGGRSAGGSLECLTKPWRN